MTKRSHGRTYRASRIVALCLLVGVLFSPLISSATPPDPEHKVTICHRTNSDTNPYVQITVDYAATDGKMVGSDHTSHEGPVYSPGLKDQHIKWGDIIPPFSWDGGSYEGMNWNETGQTIYNNDCVAQDETTTTTTVSTTTTTETPTTPTTIAVDPSTETARSVGVAESREELPQTGHGIWVLILLGSFLVALGTLFLRR